MSTKEIWKDIAGFENYYQVSNFGRVKRKKRFIECENGNKRFLKEKILFYNKSENGYIRVHLRSKLKDSMCAVHRIVAEAFIPNPEKKGFVNHKNGNPLDNSVENLEWTTRSENQLHALKTGLMSASKKVKLKSLANGNEYQFCSLAEASRFLGKNHGFLSRKLKDGKNIKGYEITLV